MTAVDAGPRRGAVAVPVGAPPDPSDRSDRSGRPDPSGLSDRWGRWRHGRAVRRVRHHAPLLGVLAVQSVLTLTLRNTAFQDEALYLYAGHQEIASLLHGTPTEDFARYFSGDPWLYPVLGSGLDAVGGLGLARAFSLVCLLVTTVAVWDVTRRLADRDAAFLAAATLAVSEPMLFMGRLATYDAPAVCLLAVAQWLVVAAGSRHVLRLSAAGPVLVLAVMTKYACLLYVPAVLVLAALAAAVAGPDDGSESDGRATGGRATGGRVRPGVVGRPAVLAASLAAAVVVALRLAGPGFLAGVRSTTTARPAGTDTVTAVLLASGRYAAAFLVLAAAGGLWWATRPSPDRGLRIRRAVLAAVLVTTVVIAPLDQAHLHTLTSLHKHVGYGMVFAAPLVGIALAALLARTRHDPRRFGAVLAICLALTALGQRQADERFREWPDASGLVAVLRTQVRAGGGHYLVEEDEVPRYYLRDLTEPYQWTGTDFFTYTDRRGAYLSGVPAYRTAIAERYFDVIALRYGPSAALDRQIDGLLRAHTGYTVIATVPIATTDGTGAFTVWRAVR